MIYDLFRDSLLDAPDAIGWGFCRVCGRPATNRHHIVPKGMGGVPMVVERRIPLIELCGMGNAGGCHGLAHSRLLHFGYDREVGWMYLVTAEPASDAWCWRNMRDGYRPILKPDGGRVYGRGAA